MDAMGREHALSQAIAVFFVVFGTLVVAWACTHGNSWEALKAIGAGISGAGIQAFTSQMRQQLTNRAGGKVVIGDQSAPTVD